MLVIPLILIYTLSASYGSTAPFLGNNVGFGSTSRFLTTPILDNTDDEVQILWVRPGSSKKSSSQIIEYIIVEDDDLAVPKEDEGAEAQSGEPPLKVLGPSLFRREDPTPLDTNVTIPTIEVPTAVTRRFQTADSNKPEMQHCQHVNAATGAILPTSWTQSCVSLSLSGSSKLRKRAGSASLAQPAAKKQKLDNTQIISHTFSMGINWKSYTIRIGAPNRLVIFNLAQSTGISELLNILKAFGTVDELEYIDDSSNCRGNVAFVKFSNKLSCANARSNLRNMVINGKVIGIDDCVGETFEAKARTIEILVPGSVKINKSAVASLFNAEYWANRYMHVVEARYNQFMEMGLLTFNTVEDAQQASNEMLSYGCKVLDV